MDGLDVWPIITGTNSSTPHEEIVLGYNFNTSHSSNQGAIIAGNYKLIVQPQRSRCNSVMWSPLDYPCSQGNEGPDCDPYCLYDIVNDPQEKKDLSTGNPDKLNQLLERYNKYSEESRDMQDQGYHSRNACPVDKDVCQYMKEHGGYWRPWKNLSQPLPPPHQKSPSSFARGQAWAASHHRKYFLCSSQFVYFILTITRPIYFLLVLITYKDHV